MVQDKRPLTSAIGALDIKTVSDVLACQQRIQLVTGPFTPGEPVQNGLAAFNHLYTVITADILQRLKDKTFQSPKSMECLDVEFAKRYFNALIAFEQSPQTCPGPWRVMLDRPTNSGVAPLPFAVAGVAAHINYDLPFALLKTWSLFPCADGTPENLAQRSDYETIDSVFYQNMTKLRRQMEDPDARALDHHLIKNLLTHSFDNTVLVDRNAAWEIAGRLDHHPDETTDTEKNLAALVEKFNAVILHS